MVLYAAGTLVATKMDKVSAGEALSDTQPSPLYSDEENPLRGDNRSPSPDGHSVARVQTRHGK